MSDAWMIPNIPAMGGGGIFATGSSGLGNAYASQAANNAYYAQQAAALQAAQVQQSQLYGGGSFGAQPAAYAALGAAYGRATGGFGGGAAKSPASVFDTGTTPYNDYGGGGAAGSFSPSPNYPGGTSPTPWEGAGFDAVKYLQQNPDVAQAGMNPWDHAQQYGFKENRQGLGWNPETYLQQNADVRAAGVNPWEHAQNYGFKEGRSGLEGLSQTDAGRNALARAMMMPAANQGYFNPGTYAGDQGNYGIPYNGTKQPGDIGFSRQPSYPNLGYNSSFGSLFTPQSGANAYPALYGAMLYPGSGTPSQQYTGDQYRAGQGGDQGLTAQDLAIPHAYPPEVRAGFRMDQQ